MHNNEYKQNIDYTQLMEKYQGYIIEWAITPSQSEPGKWMGHFRVYKDDTPTISASVINLQYTEVDARNTAVRIAKAKIDEVTTGKG